MLKLIPNWRTVLRRAYSIRFLLVAGVLSGAEAALPLFSDVLSPRVFALLMFVVVAGALVARMFAQKGVTKDD